MLLTYNISQPYGKTVKTVTSCCPEMDYDHNVLKNSSKTIYGK